MMDKSTTAAAISAAMRAIEVQKQATLSHLLQTTVNISVQQAVTLQLIDQRPGLLQKDIVAITHRRPATVSVFLKKLETDGLIERHIPDTNSRNKQIYLTKVGKAAVTAFAAAREALTEQLVSHLTDDEQDALLSALQTMQDSF